VKQRKQEERERENGRNIGVSDEGLSTATRRLDDGGGSRAALSCSGDAR
ncbi:hypothetical protein CCACVL1_02134, partial [Corchorus capsularis]